jgi:hypothetical protein
MRPITALLGIMLLASFETSAQEDREAWVRKEQEAFKQWKSDQDKEFTDYLKQQWKEFQLFAGEKIFENPKPSTPPVAQPEGPKRDAVPPPPTEPAPSAPVPVVPPPDRIAPPAVPPAPARDEPPRREPTVLSPTPSPSTGHQFTYLSEAITIDRPRTADLRLQGAPTSRSIASFWEALANSGVDTVLRQLRARREALRLNDWGLVQLFAKASQELFAGLANERTLFVWYGLVRSGIQAKAGYAGDRVFLLVASQHQIYGRPFFALGSDATRFYVVDPDGREPASVPRLFTYEKDPTGATRQLDLRFDPYPAWRVQRSERTVSFTHAGREQQVTLAYDRSGVPFYGGYPRVDLDVYLAARVSPTATASFLAALGPLVRGKSEAEAVDLLLHFVQTGFAYKTDQEQFGVERPLFPEETIHYPYSDCEDRTFLFAFLVRELVGLNVVGLLYPEHMAAAVSFDGLVEGDWVRFNGQRYTICDPTFINATAGMCMPQYRGVTPTVIQVR